MFTPLKYIFCVCIVLATHLAIAQKNIENTDSLAGRFISDLRAGTTEKLFVQTNKNISLITFFRFFNRGLDSFKVFQTSGKN